MPLLKTDATVTSYTKQSADNTKDLQLYLDKELSRLQITINQLTILSNQIYIVEPKTRLTGMVVNNKAPWDPLGLGDGLVRWNGSAWGAVALGAATAGLSHPQVMARVSLRF